MPKKHVVQKKYIVKKGDTLWRIAKQHNVSFQELKKINPDIMNRYPKVDKRYGWLFEKEEVNIPAQKLESDEELKETCQFCQKQEKFHLRVTVYYTPDNTPVEGATVVIEGPMTKKGKTDVLGLIEFPDLLPGYYTVTATYDQKDTLVEQARSHIGETTWAYNVKRSPYPKMSNKCNLFVYEAANKAGYSVPRRTRFSFSQWEWVWYPPLAGQWADPNEEIGDWQIVHDPKPGDVIAEAINYSDATGHVGIISYPEPSSEILPVFKHETTTILLQRRTVSAGGNQVLENDWGWRTGQQPRFRRYTVP